jgi:hypothetical protein
MLRAADTKIHTEQTRAEALGALFRALLWDLMTGRVRVHDLGLPAPTAGG